MQFKWNLNGYYVLGYINHKRIRLSRYLLNIHEDNEENNSLIADHINNNYLDNRMHNLRTSNDKENTYNKNTIKTGFTKHL